MTSSSPSSSTFSAKPRGKDQDDSFKLNVCYFNARSIVNKVTYMENFLKINPIHIVFIVETWLNPNISSTLVCPRGYSIIRKDRQKRKGGGIMILYKNHLPIEEICYHKPQTIEFLCITLSTKNWDAPLCFLCVYLPPDMSQEQKNDRGHV